jgi:hypothetical protein
VESAAKDFRCSNSGTVTFTLFPFGMTLMSASGAVPYLRDTALARTA